LSRALPGSSASTRLAGTLLVAVGAMLLAVKGIFTKLIYARGMDYASLVVIRSVLALPLFWAWALRHGAAEAIRRAPARAIGTAAFAGALCYGLGALLNFYALSLIDASLERALLFTYPAIVVLAGALALRQLPSLRVSGALLMTWLGVSLAVGVFDREVLAANATGAAAVLFCAGTIATYFLISERYTRLVGSLAFTVFAMTCASLVLAAWYVARYGSWPVVPDPGTWWLIVLLVIFSTVAPLLMLAEGVRRIGAERAAIVSTVGPPFTILVAWLAIDERLTVGQLLGTALIIAGILVVEIAQRRTRIVP